MHFRLFNKPAAFELNAGRGQMWIDGVYEDYHPAEPYEGFVQIHGSVGIMKLRIVDSNIPPGASVYIDQVLKRVVVKWAKYEPPSQTITEVPNGSFEDQSYWQLIGPGTPAHIEQGWSPNGKGNLTYRDQKGEYKVYGAWAPVSSINRVINIAAKVEHGKSSKGNAGCAIGLAWYDANREPTHENFGNAVENGGKGRWYDTKLSAAASDSRVKFVRPVVKFARKKQNHPIHAAQVTWDHAYVQGYAEDEQLFVEVEVTDSINNTARHRGVIDENNLWITSQPYSIASVDSMRGNEGLFVRAGGMTNPVESLQATGLFLSAVLDVVVAYKTYTIPAESMVGSGQFVSAKTDVVAQYTTYTIPTENIQSTGLFLSGRTDVVNIIRTLAPEGIASSGVFIGGSTQ